MDERLLRFFVAIYEEKNLSRAAEKCFVSQPNISNGLKQLEEIIGKELFTRHKRGVDIKESAHYLYPIAKRILSELNSIPTLFTLENKKTKIIVGVADSLPQSFKSVFFSKMSEIVKDIEWDLRPMSKDCDINLLVREWKFEDHLFLSLFKENYVLCIPNSNKLSRKDRINTQDLIDQPFIHCPPCEAHQQSLTLLNQAGKQWNTIGNCQTKTEVLTLLQAGLGLTFLPEYLVQNLNGFQIVPYNGPNNHREIGISYPQKSLNNSKINSMIKYLSENEIEF